MIEDEDDRYKGHPSYRQIEQGGPTGEWLSECGCNRITGMCFKHKLRTIQFAGRGKTKTSQMEAQWDRDMPAYKRLRRNGMQPISVKGSAEMEKRAHSQHEIELGHFIDKKDIPKVEEGMALSRELEWKPQEDTAAVKETQERRQENDLTDHQRGVLKENKRRFEGV